MHYKAPIREGDIAHHPGVLLGSDIGAGYSDLFSRALLLPHKYIRSLSCLPACIPYIIRSLFVTIVFPMFYLTS